jgi:hypothetical protein
VIGCTGFVTGRCIQVKLAGAALDTRVTRYVPWQFGIDYDIIGRGRRRTCSTSNSMCANSSVRRTAWNGSSSRQACSSASCSSLRSAWSTWRKILSSCWELEHRCHGHDARGHRSFDGGDRERYGAIVVGSGSPAKMAFAVGSGSSDAELLASALDDKPIACVAALLGVPAYWIDRLFSSMRNLDSA